MTSSSLYAGHRCGAGGASQAAQRLAPADHGGDWVPSGLAPDPERRHRAALAESSGDSEHIAEGGDSLDMDRPSPGRRHVLLRFHYEATTAQSLILGP
jgi:hypothetical protein